MALEHAWSVLKTGEAHHGDAIMLPNPMPFGYTVNCPVCKSGPHLIRDTAAADACNHAYPPCGHILRIDPDKPCSCDEGEETEQPVEPPEDDEEPYYPPIA